MVVVMAVEEEMVMVMEREMVVRCCRRSQTDQERREDRWEDETTAGHVGVYLRCGHRHKKRVGQAEG